MSAALEWLKNRGVHSGLQQTTNSFRMAAYVLAPLIVVWFGIKLFLPLEYSDIGTMFAFVGWIVYIIMLYAKLKSDAAGYLPFPQAHWSFPDGQQVSFDLLVPPNGWEKIADYVDGSRLYRVLFKDKLCVQEADRPYPDVFNRALWKLPAEWNDAFKRNAHGEFFFGNMFIDHPACENIEVGVIGWDEQAGTRLPVCIITGCSWYYEQSLKSGGKTLPNPAARSIPSDKKLQAIITDLKEENRELTTRNRFLEDEAEQYTKNEPRDIKDLSDKRLERIRGEIGDIMDTEPSMWTKIMNLRTLAIAIALIVVVVIMSHFILGFP